VVDQEMMSFVPGFFMSSLRVYFDALTPLVRWEKGHLLCGNYPSYLLLET